MLLPALPNIQSGIRKCNSHVHLVPFSFIFWLNRAVGFYLILFHQNIFMSRRMLWTDDADCDFFRTRSRFHFFFNLCKYILGKNSIVLFATTCKIECMYNLWSKKSLYVINTIFVKRKINNNQGRPQNVTDRRKITLS